MERGIMESTLNLHISAEERKRWNRAVQDIISIRNGTIVLPRANGTQPGTSMNDFTNEYRRKLDNIEEGATRYIHPPSHPASMITGLHRVATSGDYNHLVNRPTSMIASGGNTNTVNGVRVLIQSSAPSNPQINKELWINQEDRLIRIFTPAGWRALHAVWA